MRCSESSTIHGRPFPAASRISSRCRAQTGISRFTRPWSASAGSRSRCRSVQVIYAPWGRGRPLRRIGNTKEGRVDAARDDQYFLWLRQMLEYQQEVQDPQEFMQNLKVDLYPEEVYSFTPRGEVKTLPRGATIIDFAYAVHTGRGPPVRRRTRQRQDGAAADASEKWRHRRDPNRSRPHAQP